MSKLKNPSFSLGHGHGKFIESLIKRGRYKTANEVVCAALRLLEEAERARVGVADYALAEYGLTKAELERAARKVDAEIKSARRNGSMQKFV